MPAHIYEVRSRKDHRGVGLISDALPFGPAVVRRAKRSQQCGRLREVFQPLTSCCDSRLRLSGQRDRNARARGQVQRVVRLRTVRPKIDATDDYCCCDY
jgi:hypothetical protein